MTTVEHRGHGSAQADDDFDVDDPSLQRFDLVREGARRDGVEIVHYAPRFPAGRKTKGEKRIERSIALLLVLSGALGFGMVVAYIWWPFEYQRGLVESKFERIDSEVATGSSLLGPFLSPEVRPVGQVYFHAPMASATASGSTTLSTCPLPSDFSSAPAK